MTVHRVDYCLQCTLQEPPATPLVYLGDGSEMSGVGALSVLVGGGMSYSGTEQEISLAMRLNKADRWVRAILAGIIIFA